MKEAYERLNYECEELTEQLDKIKFNRDYYLLEQLCTLSGIASDLAITIEDNQHSAETFTHIGELVKVSEELYYLAMKQRAELLQKIDSKYVL